MAEEKEGGNACSVKIMVVVVVMVLSCSRENLSDLVARRRRTASRVRHRIIQQTE